MKELKDKAGETVSAIGEAVGGADSKLNGVSNFLREASGGGLFNMLSGFCETSEGANVSGIEHCRTYRSSVPRVRTFRLAG